MRSLPFLLCLLAAAAVSRAEPVEQRDELWCRYRGPSHGRAQVAVAPAPPFELAWSLDLWDPNDNGILDDHVLYDPKAPVPEGSPLGLGIAWRADRTRLYAFEMGFYRLGKRVALLDRQTGEVLDVHESTTSQPAANKAVASIHDDPGVGSPLVFLGNFYSGTRMLTVREGKLAPLDPSALGCGFAGHACEGHRWLTAGLYLDGGGLRFKDGPDYGWGSDLVWWRRGEPPTTVLEDVSVPRAVWNGTDLVLFARGGLTEATNKGTLTWQDYVRIRWDGDRGPRVVARRRVTDRKAPSAEMLFEDPPTVADPRSRMINRARNTVHAMALSVDGKWVYCHERRTAHTQRIVRRSLEDFRIDGAILPDYLPLVREVGFAGQVNPELGIGMAVDGDRFYLHRRDRIAAYTLDLKTRLFSVPVPPRTLNAHSPFAMSRYVPGTNVHFGCRGTENTLATDGTHLYLTTDTTFQVHDAATGKRIWSHTFERLPIYETSYLEGERRIQVRHYGLPGDVLVCPDAVYVATHHNQSMIFCFKPKRPE